MKKIVRTGLAFTLVAAFINAAPAFAQSPADDAYAAGKTAFDSKDYNKAVGSLSTCLKQAPNFAKALELRGSSYLELKQYDKAIADYNAAIKVDPKMDLAWYGRGTAYYGAGKYQQSIDDLSRYLAKWPSDDLALSTRGKAYEKLGKNDLAQKDLNAIEYAKIIKNARDRFSQKKYDEAINLANQAIQLDPSKSTGYGFRGEAYEKQKKFDLALADFQKKVELSPKDDPGPLYFVAHCYFDMGQFEKCAEVCEKYNAMKTDDAQAWFLQANAYQEAKKYPEALKAYNKACDLAAGNYLYLYFRGRNYRLSGDYDKAIADISESYKLAPNEQWVLVERAIAYEKQGKNDIADKDRQVMKDAGYSEWNQKN